LGSPGGETGTGIALDTAGNPHVIGTTSAAGFPVTATAADLTFNGATDTFVTRINAAGTAVTYSTYLGSPGRDIGNGIAVRNGDDYLVGLTDNPAFPIAGAPFDPGFNGGLDAFVARIRAAGPLDYSTFLGGTGNETGFAIAVAGNTDVYVTGETTSNPFPTVAAVDPTYNGGIDAFVTRF
ncbi:MAG TPA: SBBP repeat-containing protein, partial [Kofleriaceae bacterium]|nr:SBBP repeat-containing protein [Kofleriaceae bacterium]